MSEIACISFDLFSQYLSERCAMLTQYFLLFVSYAVLIFFYIELVEFCDAINIKGEK